MCREYLITMWPLTVCSLVFPVISGILRETSGDVEERREDFGSGCVTEGLSLEEGTSTPETDMYSKVSNERHSYWSYSNPQLLQLTFESWNVQFKLWSWLLTQWWMANSLKDSKVSSSRSYQWFLWPTSDSQSGNKWMRENSVLLEGIHIFGYLLIWILHISNMRWCIQNCI